MTEIKLPAALFLPVAQGPAEARSVGLDEVQFHWRGSIGDRLRYGGRSNRDTGSRRRWRRIDRVVSRNSEGLRRGWGLKFAFQETFVLSAVNPEGCSGELGEGRRSGVLVDQAVLHDRLEAFVKLARKGFVVSLDESLDLAEVGEVGGDGGGLVQVPEFSFLGSHDVRVAKGILQGLGILFKGLELDWDSLRRTIGERLCVLVQERLEPVVRGSVEVAGGKENLLGLGREEFRVAEEVVSTLGEVEVQFVSVSRVHVGERYLCASSWRERMRSERRQRLSG